MFIFQPAEESAPEGEEGGAELMLKEGIFCRRATRRSARDSCLVSSPIPVVIGYRKGPLMASSRPFSK